MWKFMFRYNIEQVSDIFCGYFKPIQDIHDHNTRSCSGLYAWQPKTELTHCGLVTPYGDIDLGQYWLK